MMRIEPATVNDIVPLLGLYNLVYGSTYPLAIGTDAAVMRAVITNPDDLWLVVRSEQNEIIASLVAEQDMQNKIGRLQALVVHPEHRRLNLGSKLAEEIVRRTLGAEGSMNSLYTTTRTLSIGPQNIFLNLGFLPLGLFPNAHRVKEYETLTLLGKFRDGVLAERPALPAVPEKLLPILTVLNSLVPTEQKRAIQISATPPRASGAPEHEFELIYAPDFVRRRFISTFSDPQERFYPFHEPNLLISAKGGGPELYAYFGKQDGYCTIVAGTETFWQLAPSIDAMVRQLLDFGVSYIETLLPIFKTDSLKVLLEHQFIPSAVYPAMTVVQGAMQDFVLLSRTAEPLNFRGMAIDRRFKPYIDQYVRQWSQTYFEAMEVIGGGDR
jgi:GNAT superfamily N-acetyltransferase